VIAELSDLADAPILVRIGERGIAARRAAGALLWRRSIIRVMARRLAFGVAVAALVAGACSPGASSGTAAPPVAPQSATPPAATGSVAPAPSESAGPAAELVVGGDRPVTVHVPASYDPNRPAPLLLLLHGFTSSGDEVEGYLDVADAADRAGVVYVAPDGSKNANGDRFWNATDACCNFDDSSVDDVAYLSGVIADIQDELAIDPTRIGIVGHSNGGFMAYRMACERADLVASIVSLAGATFADPADCQPSEPVSVAQAHGTADDTILFDGGGPLTDGSGPFPGAETTATTWAAYDGCAKKASALDERIDIDANLADGTDPAETSVREWAGCEDGAAVQLWTIHNGGHVPEPTPAFADAVVRFLVEHPKP
jgi:polyhydroxybutyrate depolymerase